jgi:chromatin segregation and condensation protein Rec8/ScpA/Scc1 (kleisin family)
MPPMDVYLVEIEKQMKKLYKTLSQRVKGTGIIQFSTLINNMERLEAIQTFIILLFLAQNIKIDIWQDEENEEIYITIGDLNVAER